MTANVLQIGEGTNGVGFSEGFDVLLAAVFFLFDYHYFRKYFENIEKVCKFK
jgi:hypothetical protein